MDYTPDQGIILAGLLANLALGRIWNTETTSTIALTDLCQKHDLLWTFPVIITVITTAVLAVKHRGLECIKLFVTLSLGCVESFVLGLLVDSTLSCYAVLCTSQYSRDSWHVTETPTDLQKNSEWYRIEELYRQATCPIILIGSIAFMVHFYMKTPQFTGKILDPEVLLIGVCVQSGLGKIITAVEPISDAFCEFQGAIAWLEILAVAIIFTFPAVLKPPSDNRNIRSGLTCVALFLLFLTLVSGELALRCGVRDSLKRMSWSNVISYIDVAAAGGLVFTTFYLNGRKPKKIEVVPNPAADPS